MFGAMPDKTPGQVFARSGFSSMPFKHDGRLNDSGLRVLPTEKYTALSVVAKEKTPQSRHSRVCRLINVTAATLIAAPTSCGNDKVSLRNKKAQIRPNNGIKFKKLPA